MVLPAFKVVTTVSVSQALGETSARFGAKRGQRPVIRRGYQRLPGGAL